MEKTFAPQDIETKWYKTWEQRGYFAPKAGSDKAPLDGLPPHPGL